MLDLIAFKPDKWDKLVKDLEEYWKNKNGQQLLEVIFLEKFVNGCSATIVFHPVEQYSIRIERNPKIDGKWWLNTPPKKTICNTNNSEGEEIMPCARCLGRAKD
jgi:hypothetical protein